MLKSRKKAYVILAALLLFGLTEALACPISPDAYYYKITPAGAFGYSYYKSGYLELYLGPVYIEQARSPLAEVRAFDNRVSFIVPHIGLQGLCFLGYFVVLARPAIKKKRD